MPRLVPAALAALAAFAALAALAAGAGSARAESLVAIRDPAYGFAPGPEETRPVASRIRQIVYPVLGMPALVRPGERFSVLLRADCAPDLAALAARAALLRVPEVEAPLAVLALHAEPGMPGLSRVHLRAPADLAADSWDLTLDDGTCVRDRQPAALRVYHDAEAFRLAVIADEQLGDPTALLDGGDANGTLFPARGLADIAARRRLQLREELELLDPLLVLYPGDLVFGMDYGAEYTAIAERLGNMRLAVFAVPGNHDAYALHEVGLKPGWPLGVHRLAWCAGRWSPLSPLDGLTAVGACLVERLGDALQYQLETDGLLAWRRTLGPDAFALRVGGVRFVGLNSYGGSMARRQAVPVTLGRLREWADLDLFRDLGMDPEVGAPLVDNYGGFVEPGLAAWTRAQAEAARAAGEGLVVFAHHDPTGAYLGRSGIAPNEPFGTDPVGAGPFEVWNYDDAWDSDPADGVGRETAAASTGTGLAARLSGSTWICGHAHHDAEREVPAGEGSALRVLQVTTAGAGLAVGGAQRGYRLLTVRDGRLGPAVFDSARHWDSVPLGNFWTESILRPDGPPDRALVNGLPVLVTGRLRMDLPPAVGGYRFLVSGEGLAGEQELPMAESLADARRFVAWLPVELPAARTSDPVARDPAEVARREVRWEVAEGNQPPVAVVQRAGRPPPRSGTPLHARAGRPLRLTAAGSVDEQGVLAATWTVGGLQRTGVDVEVVIDRPGRYPLRLTVVDPQGAVGEVAAEVRVRRTWLRRAREGRGG